MAVSTFCIFLSSPKKPTANLIISFKRPSWKIHNHSKVYDHPSQRIYGQSLSLYADDVAFVGCDNNGDPNYALNTRSGSFSVQTCLPRTGNQISASLEVHVGSFKVFNSLRLDPEAAICSSRSPPRPSLDHLRSPISTSLEVTPP
jgi:hypothetical protein